MSVMFKTQQGRTLRNDAMNTDDVERALGSDVAIEGYEAEYAGGDIIPPVFHVNTRHVVEWWTP